MADGGIEVITRAESKLVAVNADGSDMPRSR